MSESASIFHALAIAGRCSEERIADIAQLPLPVVAATVAQCIDDGRMTRSRLGLKLTALGTTQWQTALAGERALLADATGESVYRRFMTLNHEFKTWITEYQTAANKPSVQQLWPLHTALEATLAPLLTTLPRFATYSPRFNHALEQIAAGHLEFIAAPTCASFHTVWFELHEDLILVFGRNRHADEQAEAAQIIAPNAEASSAETANVIHQISGPEVKWSRVNMAESVIGVQTPLSWSLWDAGGELGFRLGYYRLGLLPRAALTIPESIDQQFTALFYGQGACNIDAFSAAMAALPGTGSAAEAGFFSSRSRGAQLGGHWRRARVRVQLPLVALLLPRRMHKLRTRAEEFWRRTTAPGALPDDSAARRALDAALQQFADAIGMQIVASTLTGFFYGYLQRTLARLGRPELESRLIGGYGSMQEIRLTQDLWRIANGDGSLEGFLAEHGFHGPAEGELSSRSWREHPAPIEAMLTKFGAVATAAAPAAAEVRQADERRHAESTLLAATSGIDRLRTRLLLALSRRFIPLRVEAKASFMQMFDVARAAARVIGARLVAAGRLDTAEDVFYLTLDELRGQLPADCAGAVRERRALRERYLQLELPLDWVGMPVPTAPTAQATVSDIRQINALGVSAGVVEGIAKVLIDPNDTDGFEPGDILVCHTTDPSWSSHFFIAAAVVIDIGGALSHGAIVARELGIACVINTRIGTRAIRSGDRIRVDGDTGTVDILETATSH